ncbi:hypothetical protein X753_24975 [Mesorhizobium sp. LNJC399B00]|uniref:hypothetical protein n=1 Tax=unclassified Mesorhizobium TaxID=325217 RepID=UPI0003CDF979|nr:MULTISPECIES: hypothetical protein [unclassified Mesorhizobium]ESY02037.1 hypothetical protein X753_24975 [Mesorhizobium sp. LNJC399B00]WJI72116.1 hypothetical protein NLY36_15480 [Mesorhizobium sp. C399B]
MTHYDDNPNKYQTDNTTVAKAMFRAQEAEQAANEAKQAALAEQAKEEAFKADIAHRTELGLRANQQLNAKRSGFNTGQALNEGQQARAAAANASAFNAAPQALVDQLPVTIGGIQLGPQQAKDMLARGEIRQADYVAAVNVALKPYGSSFR